MVTSRGAARARPGEVHLWRLAVGATRRGLEAAVRNILGAYVGLPPGKVRLLRGSRGGRPSLPPALCPGLSFNLSHSHRAAMLAVTRGADVGIDLEWMRTGVRVDGVIRRFFSERESEALLGLPPQERERAFFRTWVRKEAYLKAIGAGVPAGLSRFSVSVGPDAAPEVVTTELEDGGVSVFSLYDLALSNGYVGALAVEGTGHTIAAFDGTVEGPDGTQ